MKIKNPTISGKRRAGSQTNRDLRSKIADMLRFPKILPDQNGQLG